MAKKQKEYIATSLVQQFMDDHKGMPEDLIKRKEWFQAQGFSGSDLNECMISSICFSGFWKTKQAYRFHPELIKELMDGGPMDFYLNDLNLPFFDLYFDLTGCGIMVDGKPVVGAFLSAFLDTNEPTLCMVGVLEESSRDHGQIFKLVFCSTNKIIKEKVQDLIHHITGGMKGDTVYTELIIRCMAYISSEKPDVIDHGIVIVKGSTHTRKTLPARLHTWNVGYRYIRERARQKKEIISLSRDEPSDRTLRPHMRRGHWHTYHVGPGRKETKVIWVSQCQIGRGEQPAVIRLPEREGRNI